MLLTRGGGGMCPIFVSNIFVYVLVSCNFVAGVVSGVLSLYPISRSAVRRLGGYVVLYHFPGGCRLVGRGAFYGSTCFVRGKVAHSF